MPVPTDNSTGDQWLQTMQQQLLPAAVFTTVKSLKDGITLMSRVFIFLAIKSPFVSWHFIFNNNTVINRFEKRHTAGHRVTSLTIETARYHV